MRTLLSKGQALIVLLSLNTSFIHPCITHAVWTVQQKRIITQYLDKFQDTNCVQIEQYERHIKFSKWWPFNAGIKSFRATLPAEIFTGDFASWTVHFVNICVKNQQMQQLFIVY
jgi:hypothetical protein